MGVERTDPYKGMFQKNRFLKKKTNHKVMQNNNLTSSCVLTADIGGSHLTLGICHLSAYTIIDNTTTRVEFDSKGSATEILKVWADAFQKVLKKKASLPISGLSVAMPGPFDYQKGISYIKGLDKYEALYGMNIRNCFSDILKLDPGMIRFRNDAESTIAGEVLTGAGMDCKRVLGITLGTGFGSAFCEKNITRDINLGSEFYKDSIADDYLSTRWFLNRYYELTGMVLVGGVKELAELASKNAVARDIFKEFAFNMSDFLSPPVKRLEPEVLIICGNIAKASEFFLPYLTGELNTLPHRLAQLGENAPLIGAAAMFDNITRPTSFDSVNQL